MIPLRFREDDLVERTDRHASMCCQQARLLLQRTIEAGTRPDPRTLAEVGLGAPDGLRIGRSRISSAHPAIICEDPRMSRAPRKRTEGTVPAVPSSQSGRGITSILRVGYQLNMKAR